MSVYEWVCVYKCVCVNECVCISDCVYVYKWMCMYEWVCMNECVYACACVLWVLVSMSACSCQSRTWAEQFCHSLHQSLAAGTLSEPGACPWCPPVPSPYSAGVADTDVTTHKFFHWDLNSGLGVCAARALTHCEMTLSCKSWVLWSSVFHLCCCRAPWHFPGTSPFFLGLHHLFHTWILLGT